MNKTFGTLLPIMILGILCSPIMGCSKKTDRYLSELADCRKLSTLAFIGTHDSATYSITLPQVKTQNMSISEQLESGVRVFDMRVRMTENVFAMNHGPIFLGMMFGDLIIQVRDFLRAHPREVIIMFMQVTHETSNSDKTECEILRDKYEKDFSNLFVENWSVDDTLLQHRGKVLLARGKRGFQSCTTKLHSKEQNKWEITNLYTTEQKFSDIKAFQDEMFQLNREKSVFINYLSGNGIRVTPYEIAHDLPVAGQGMVQQMTGYFKNPKNSLYIVMADFPTKNLCKKITDSNY